MHWIIAYLALGNLVLLGFLIDSRLRTPRKQKSDWGELSDLILRPNRTWISRVAENYLIPALTAVLVLIAWPVAVAFTIYYYRSSDKRSAQDGGGVPLEFTVTRENLGQSFSLEEIETRLHAIAPALMQKTRIASSDSKERLAELAGPPPWALQEQDEPFSLELAAGSDLYSKTAVWREEQNSNTSVRTSISPNGSKKSKEPIGNKSIRTGWITTPSRWALANLMLKPVYAPRQFVQNMVPLARWPLRALKRRRELPLRRSLTADSAHVE